MKDGGNTLAVSRGAFSNRMSSGMNRKSRGSEDDSNSAPSQLQHPQGTDATVRRSGQGSRGEGGSTSAPFALVRSVEILGVRGAGEGAGAGAGEGEGEDASKVEGEAAGEAEAVAEGEGGAYS
jgi:hypothetical protein